MGILDIFGKRDVRAELTKKIPYGLTLSFTPYRLKAHKNEFVNLKIYIKNLTEETLLTSIVINLPKKLGFDRAGINHVREIRLGYMSADEEREIDVPIWGNSSTEDGEYPITLTAYCHYRDYAHILNSEKKKLILRVV